MGSFDEANPNSRGVKCWEDQKWCVLGQDLGSVPGEERVLRGSSARSRAGARSHNRGRLQDGEETARLEREAQKKMNKERQEKLKHDTDELLKLATELKEYVDKTNENILSLNVVKKAEQIEKLAHSVKEKMRDNN